MRRRRTDATLAIDPIRCFTWSNTGLDSILSLPHYRTAAEARRAWEQARRAIWARARRGFLPGPAKHYDGLTNEAHDYFQLEWSCTVFSSARVDPAIATDRAAIAAFRKTNPKGARSIEDFLDVWLQYLEQVENQSRAADGLDFFVRLKRFSHPSHWASPTYADFCAARQ